MTDQIKKFNFDTLLKIALDRVEPIAEIEFMGRSLVVRTPQVLGKKYALLLARSQAKLQDYFAPILKLQEQGATGFDAAAKVALTMLQSERETYEASLEYIEAVCELDEGSIKQLIDEYIKQLQAQQESLGSRVLSDRQIADAPFLFVSQAVQLIRNAIADSEKRMNEAVEESNASPKAIVMLEQEEPLELSSAKSKRLKATA